MPVKVYGKVDKLIEKFDENGLMEYYAIVTVINDFPKKPKSKEEILNQKILKLIKANPNYTQEEFYKTRTKYLKQKEFVRKLVKSNKRIHWEDESNDEVRRFEKYVKNTYLEKEINELRKGQLHLDRVLTFKNKQFAICVITSKAMENFMSVFVQDKLENNSCNDNMFYENNFATKDKFWKSKVYDCVYLFYKIEMALRQEAINSWFRDERKNKKFDSFAAQILNLRSWIIDDKKEEEYEDNFNSVIKQMSEVEMAEKTKERKSIFSIFDNVDGWEISKFCKPTSYNSGGTRVT